MPTLAETQLKELTAWLAASSQDERSPMGDAIIHDDYGQLVTVALDDPAPDLSAAIALGCLPLLVAYDVPAATFAAIEGQAKLDERAAHVVWLSGAQRHGLPDLSGGSGRRRADFAPSGCFCGR